MLPFGYLCPVSTVNLLTARSFPGTRSTQPPEALRNASESCTLHGGWAVSINGVTKVRGAEQSSITKNDLTTLFLFLSQPTVPSLLM